MKSLLTIGLMFASVVIAPAAQASTGTVLTNLYKPNQTACKLDNESKPFDSKVLAKKLVINNNKRFTASVYQLDYSRLNNYEKTYYYRIQYNGKVVSNLVVNVMQNMHPHGGPDGQNIGITACGSKIKPTLKIGTESKKLTGYIPTSFLTRINEEFDWKKINISNK
jgi:hypothetical protein